MSDEESNVYNMDKEEEGPATEASPALEPRNSKSSLEGKEEGGE